MKSVSVLQEEEETPEGSVSECMLRRKDRRRPSEKAAHLQGEERGLAKKYPANT